MYVLVRVKFYSIGVWNKGSRRVLVSLRSGLNFTPLGFETPFHKRVCRLFDLVKFYSIGVWNPILGWILIQFLWLNFTPLGFETFQWSRFRHLQLEVKFYSIGVWNNLSLSQTKKAQIWVKFYSIGVWNFRLAIFGWSVKMRLNFTPLGFETYPRAYLLYPSAWLNFTPLEFETQTYA